MVLMNDLTDPTEYDSEVCLRQKGNVGCIYLDSSVYALFDNLFSI